MIPLGRGEKKDSIEAGRGLEEELQCLATIVPGLKKLYRLLYTEIVPGSWDPRALFDQLGNSKAGQPRGGRRGNERRKVVHRAIEEG